MNENFTKGAVCSFNFYVMSFDTHNNYRDFSEPIVNLNLKQAVDIFARKVRENPTHVNTMLGVNYHTDRKDLEPMGFGSVELLQCIDGNVRLSKDYTHNAVLSNVSLILINTINVLSDKMPEINKTLGPTEDSLEEKFDEIEM